MYVGMHCMIDGTTVSSHIDELCFTTYVIRCTYVANYRMCILSSVSGFCIDSIIIIHT